MSFRILLSIIFSGVLLTSCVKNEEKFTPYQDLGLVESLIKRINNGTESYTINPNEYNQIITADEAIITIPAGAIVDKNNQQINGNVKLLYTNIVSSGQALLSSNSTMVNGEPFYANTMTMVSAISLQGESLKLNDTDVMSVSYPSDVEMIEDDIKIFKGLETDARFSWSEINDPREQNKLRIGNWEVEGENGSIFGSGYQYNLNQLGWFGIGKYISGGSGESMKMCVDLPNLFNSNNTKVFFVFEDLISIVNLQALNENNDGFCGQVNIPDQEGMYSIISISSTENEDYYLGILSNPNTLESSFEINPQKKTLKEITDFLYQK